MPLQQLADQIKKDGGYIDVRVLADDSIAAIGDLLYTRAIFMSCDINGYGNRFCFDDKELANQRFAELQTEDDVPQGHIARR